MRPFLLAALFLVPALVGAATIGAERNVTLSVSPTDNTYLAGKAVRVAAPVIADLSAFGGSIALVAPVGGDALVLGGTVNSADAVTGDLRALGAHIMVTGNTGGDLAAFGGRVDMTGAARDVLVMAASIRASGSSTGPVELYGADIELNGDYAGDVTVIATDRFTLGPNAHVGGELRYSAPQQLTVPPTARLDGGATYTGSFRYVPTNQEAKTYALFGIGIFFIVRTLGAMIVAGLIAGIFPVWTDRLLGDMLALTVRRSLAALLLGAAIFIGGPLIVLLLIASFAGASLALLLGALYMMFVLLAGAYASILVGALLRAHAFSRFRGNFEFTWRDAVIGALVLYFIGTIPFIGAPVHALFVLVAAGSLALRLYRAVIESNH